MKRDIHIQLIDPTEQTWRAVFTFGRGAPIAVTGPQKLLNRWVKVFMTPVGSHPVRRSEGTRFSSLLRANVEFDRVQPDILEAVDDATEQVRAADRQTPGRHPSEAIRSATVTRFNLLGASGVEFWVEIANMAGERIRVLFPYASRR